MDKPPQDKSSIQLLPMISLILMFKNSLKTRFHVELMKDSTLKPFLDGALKSLLCLRKLSTQVQTTELSLS